MIERRTVVAVDIVELSPIPGNVAPNFLVAKLVYKILTYRSRDRRPHRRLIHGISVRLQPDRDGPPKRNYDVFFNVSSSFFASPVNGDRIFVHQLREGLLRVGTFPASR